MKLNLWDVSAECQLFPREGYVDSVRGLYSLIDVTTQHPLFSILISSRIPAMCGSSSQLIAPVEECSNGSRPVGLSKRIKLFKESETAL
jgi:hypothetical protein